MINILQDLGIEYNENDKIIEVNNKCDLLDGEQIEIFQRAQSSSMMPSCMISAYRNKGLEKLYEHILSILQRNNTRLSYKIDIRDGKAIAWLYENSCIIERRDTDKNAYITASISSLVAQKFAKKFGYNVPE